MATVKILKSKTTTIVLAILFGGFGAHHFYLGNSKRGLLYFVFCWTFIPFLIGFIDFVVVMRKSEDDFNLQYNPDEYKEKYRKVLQKLPEFTHTLTPVYSSFNEVIIKEGSLQLQ